jgi:hypothetical protein
MSDQDNQNYAPMAAAVAIAYAQKKARDEARKALIISTALNQNMSSLDPKTQAELQQLLQAEARRGIAFLRASSCAESSLACSVAGTKFENDRTSRRNFSYSFRCALVHSALTSFHESCRPFSPSIHLCLRISSLMR